MPKPQKHSFNISGHQTSITLEIEFWQALKAIALAKSQSLSQLIMQIDAQRLDENLSSAVRVYILKYYQPS
ncbi:MAG: ribbon-helix-helix domain-containing protein [Rhizobiales bacterium]|nr:ribbon-helix-helix domain-containing protein [Hyphomicrobiales bacterium]NRB13957.1 ribbon-helix-helix domain-containing protein [Hyphomicrobiales bacterium]